MMMHRFYVEDGLKAGAATEIKGDEARHIRSVLRLKAGDAIILFDGSGYEFTGRLDGFGKESVSVDILKGRKADTESPLEIVLGQGIPKSDKMDLIVQKSTELGISKIVPLFSERVLSKDVSRQKVERWRRIAIEACKQSGRVRPPVISEPERIDDFILNTDSPSLKLLPWEGERVRSLKEAIRSAGDVRKVSFIVGPEGGLSHAEVDFAVKGGYVPVTLGRRILRTETVSLSMLSIIQFMLGDI